MPASLALGNDALFRSICDATGDAIFVKDATGRYAYVNPTCARLFGADVSAIVGTDDDRWFGPTVGDELRAIDATIRERGEPLVYEEERELEGRHWVFSTSKAPCRDETGAIVGVIGIARDITEARMAQRAIQAERDRLAAIAKAAPGALYSYRRDAAGNVTLPYASDAMTDLYGACPEELRANPRIVFERIAPEDVARVVEAIEASAASMTPWTCEFQICHPTRGRLLAYGSSRPIREPDGSITWHGMLMDVTAHRRLERELRTERDRFAGISTASPAALYTYRRDREGRGALLFGSVAMETIYGASAAEMEADPSLMASRIADEDRERVFAAIAGSAATMTQWQCEWRIQHPTRGTVWVAGHSTPVPGPDGAIVWHGVLLDITERVRVEAEIRAERDRFAALAATAPGTIYTYRELPDGTSDFPFVAPTAEDVYGITGAELQARPSLVFERMHIDDLTGVLETLAEARETMSTWQHEFRIAHPVKGERWIQCRARPLRAPDGALHWHGILTDVTDRKRADEKVRESETTLRGIVEATPDFMILVGRDLKIRFINHLMPGFQMSDVVGSPALQYITPDSRDTVGRALTQVLATGEPQSVEVEVKGADGGAFWFITRCSAVREEAEIIGAVMTSTDITPRRRAELALAESDHRHRTLLDLLPDAVFVNTKGRITYCNAAFVRLMGAASADELNGRTPFEVFHPDDHATIRERIASMHVSGKSAPPVEETLLGLDGIARPVSVVAAMLGDDVIVVLHDLTERLRAERLLRSVLESVNDAILTIDVKGTIRSCNPATSRLLGFTPEELIGNNVKMIMPEDVARHHDGFLSRYMATGEAKVIGVGREVFAQRKDGSTFPVELSVTSFRLNDLVHYTGVIRDITARKRLEEQFRQAHKMEAFGQLAGGVAHDFNNLLTVILGATESLADMLPKTVDPTWDDARGALADVYDAGERAASLTRQLLAFSRKTVLEPRVIDVNTTVRELQKMLRRLIGEDVTLSTHLVPNLAHVNVDPGQLLQVLMNLAVNARDAMPSGGRLDVETDNRTLDEAAAEALGLRAGAYIEIRVTDTGTGMTDEVRSRLFQPFFTTKGVGKGTGLGLAVVHGIVTQSSGTITVDSEVGRGTTFRILLPAVAETAARTTASRSEGVERANETVLVVEDDEMVRRLAVRCLTSRGYQVLVAPDGLAALEILAATASTIDVVVTDVVMPKLDGAKLGDEIRARYPTIKVIYVSGYTHDMLEGRGLQSEQVEFLSKPYTPATLTKAVARVLRRTTIPPIDTAV